MNTGLLLVLLLLAICIVMFIRDKPRMDYVALLALLVLPFTGIITPAEALAGFSDPSIILIALMFVIGEGLVRTGIAYQLGQWIINRAGNSETRLLIFLMVAVTTLGSVMSSTGIVAVFIPVVLGIARQLQIPPGRLMMPLAFAGLISGMTTLVATPPNLVVQSGLLNGGFAGLEFFAFTPIGAVILLAAILYMLLVRRWLTPPAQPSANSEELSLAALARRYQLNERERRLRVKPGSPLAGQPLNALALRQQYGLNVIAIERRQSLRIRLLIATGNTMLAEGDVLLVDIADPRMNFSELCQRHGLEALPLHTSYYNRYPNQLGLAEVALLPESELPGKSIQELGFRSRHRLNVVGLRRNRTALPGLLVGEKLHASDTLLVAGSWNDITRLQTNRDYIVLSLPLEASNETPEASRAPYALLSLAIMIGLMVSGAVANVTAALIACLLMGATGCLTMNSAYKAIHWPSLLLIVGMMPFALALQKTGGIQLAADTLIQLTGTAGPYALMASLFVLTAVTGMFISNTATAILLAPVALSSAAALGVSPYPFAMTIAIAASAAFIPSPPFSEHKKALLFWDAFWQMPPAPRRT